MLDILQILRWEGRIFCEIILELYQFMCMNISFYVRIHLILCQKHKIKGWIQCGKEVSTFADKPRLFMTPLWITVNPAMGRDTCGRNSLISSQKQLCHVSALLLFWFRMKRFLLKLNIVAEVGAVHCRSSLASKLLPVPKMMSDFYSCIAFYFIPITHLVLSFCVEFPFRPHVCGGFLTVLSFLLPQTVCL